MSKQICFVGEYGAGKSHTISDLVLDPTLREQLVVSNAFAHGTTQETVIDFGDFTVLDTRGLDSDELDDDELIEQIGALTHDRTVFVWVINGRSRRIKATAKLVHQLVGSRRLVIFINDRNNRPLSNGWMEYSPSAARASTIAELKATFPAATITSNHLAIVPLIIGPVEGADLVTSSLDKLNANALLRYKETIAARAEINRQMELNLTRVCEARSTFLKLVDVEEQKSNKGLGYLLLGLAGAVGALVLLPFVAPLFAAAGLAGAAATSSGMAVIGLGAMATAPVVAGAVGGVAGVVAGGIGNAVLAPGAGFRASRPQQLGVDFQMSAEEAKALEEDQAGLADYYSRLQRAKPCTDSRELFRRLPSYRFLALLPPFESAAMVTDTQFDGPLYHLLCDAL